MTTTTLPGAGHGGVANAVSDVLTMVGRSIRLARRNLDTLVLAIVLPVMMMALFVYVFGGAIDTGGGAGAGYLDYVVPGIILLCTGYGASTTAVVVASDMQEGMVDRLRSMPIRSSALLTGHVVGSVARNGLSTTIVVLLAVAMGFRPTAGLGEWLLAAGLLLLYVLGLSWIAAGFGVVAKTVESAGVFSFFMLFLPYLSSAFVPTGSMPAVLRAVSEHQPITPIIETIRGLLAGTPIDRGWIALAWSLGLVAAGFAFALTAFVRKVRA